MAKVKNHHSKSFFDFFPAPRFLKMSTVGLALSDEAIRTIELKGNSIGHELGAHGEIALENGIIESGYINDIPALARVLKELKNRKNLSFVRASLPEEKGYIFTLRIPRLSYKEMRSNIEFSIEENVPVKLADVIFDFNIIPDTEDEKGSVEVAVSVLPLKAVDAYVEALKSADIEPVAFEVESQAIARAVIEREDKGVFVVVNLSSHKAGLYIVTKGIVVFSSTVLLSDDSLAGLAMESFITKEIQKILLFWETHGNVSMKKSQHVSGVRVVGSHSNWNAIVEHLIGELTIPVIVPDVWMNAFSVDTYVPDITKEDSLRFAAAVGLALPMSNE